MTSPAGRVSIPPFSTADTPDEREMMRWALERLQPLVLDWRDEDEWPCVAIDGVLLQAGILDTLEELQADDLELTTRDLADDAGWQPPPASGTSW